MMPMTAYGQVPQTGYVGAVPYNQVPNYGVAPQGIPQLAMQYGQVPQMANLQPVSSTRSASGGMMREYEAPLFPDGTPLPPDVCQLLGFPLGTISRGLNITWSMLEEMKRERGLPTSSPPRAKTPAMYSQSSTPHKSDIEEEAEKLKAQFQELKNQAAHSAAMMEGAAPIAQLQQDETERNLYEADETIMMPCCRSRLPRSTAEHALKHSDSCPCCNASGINSSMLLPCQPEGLYEVDETVMMPCCGTFLTRSVAEEMLREHGGYCPCCQTSGVEASMLLPASNKQCAAAGESVRLPCCRATVPKSKIAKKLHDGHQNCPCCQATGIESVMLKPLILLSGSIQEIELPPIGDGNWFDQVEMPCCKSHLCRTHAVKIVGETGKCPICDQEGLAVSDLVELSGFVNEIEFGGDAASRTASDRSLTRQKSFGSRTGSFRRQQEQDFEPENVELRPVPLEDIEKYKKEEEQINFLDKVKLRPVARRPSGTPLDEAKNFDREGSGGVKFKKSMFVKSTEPVKPGKWAQVNSTPQGFIRHTTMFSDAPKLFSKSMTSLPVPVNRRKKSDEGQPKPAPMPAQNDDYSNLSLSELSKLMNEEAGATRVPSANEPEGSESFMIPSMTAP